jgi:uncharacterized protein (DUF111 family)
VRYLIIILLLSSCSAQWHIKQACKKEPALCTPDTFTITDTIKVHDSLYFEKTVVTKEIDTITIDTGSIRVKVIRYKDTIKTIITQRPKTIIKTKTITTKPRLVYKEQDYPWWLVIVAIVLFILLIIKR